MVPPERRPITRKTRLQKTVYLLGEKRGGVRTTVISEIRLVLEAGQARPPDGIYRVEPEPDGEAWICTPDYRRIAKLRRRLRDHARGLLSARFVVGDNRAIIRRSGRGRAAWLEPEK
jgi:hypothetical protein